MSVTFDFSGRSVLVTRAGAGIGLAIAGAFARSGPARRRRTEHLMDREVVHCARHGRACEQGVGHA